MAAGAEPFAITATRLRPDAWSLRAPPALLDGNVPVRAAQFCAPFLAGNSAGLWLSPPRPIVVTRARRGFSCSDPSVTVRESGQRITAQIDAGLALSFSAARVQLDRAYNRCDRRVSVREAPVAPDAPLRFELSLPREALDRALVLDGPLASLLALPSIARWASATTEQARALLARHRAFFDPTYFENKREGPTRRYRDGLARASHEPEPSLVDPSRCDAVAFSFGAAASLDGDALALRAECAVSAEHYGASTRCALDEGALEARRRALLDALAPYGDSLRDDPAIEYLARYAVAHTGGDPHALIKPSVLIATRPGWSLVLDGPREGVARGVLESSWFHAAPIVMDVRGTLTIAAGSPLARARAVPDALLRPLVIDRG